MILGARSQFWGALVSALFSWGLLGRPVTDPLAVNGIKPPSGALLVTGSLSCTGSPCGSGGGGGGGGVVAVASTSAVDSYSCATNMPWGIGSGDDVLRPKASGSLSGCLINTVSAAVASTADWVQVSANADIGISGNGSGVCAIFAGSTNLATTIVSGASNFDQDAQLVGWWKPTTTASVAYKLRCGPGDTSGGGSGGAVYINTRVFGTEPLYTDGTPTFLRVVEFGSGSGGGGTTYTATAPVTLTGNAFGMPASTDSVDGYLTHTDHATLSSLAAAVTLDHSYTESFGTVAADSDVEITEAAAPVSATDVCSMSMNHAFTTQGAILQAMPSAGHVTLMVFCLHGASSCAMGASIDYHVICRS